MNNSDQPLLDKTAKVLFSLTFAFLLFALSLIWIMETNTLACHRGVDDLHCHPKGIDHGHRTPIFPLNWKEKI